MGAFPDGFREVSEAYAKRFDNDIPTMVIPHTRFAEAMEVAKKCLETGEDNLLEHFGIDYSDSAIIYA